MWTCPECETKNEDSRTNCNCCGQEKEPKENVILPDNYVKKNIKDSKVFTLSLNTDVSTQYDLNAKSSSINGSTTNDNVLKREERKDRFKPSILLIALICIVIVSFSIPHYQLNRGSIDDSWEEIIASVNNGTYKSKYKIGDTKSIDLGSMGIVEMQIVAFDADELADRSGTAAITWISKSLLKPNHQMNPDLTKSIDEMNMNDPKVLEKQLSDHWREVMKYGGCWERTELREWLKEDVTPQIPETVRKSIKPVIKYSESYDTSSQQLNEKSSVENIWIPSYREVFGTQEIEKNGPSYTKVFTSNNDRIRKRHLGLFDSIYWYICGPGTQNYWWLRSVSTEHYFRMVSKKGSDGSQTEDSFFSIVIGFCM